MSRPVRYVDVPLDVWAAELASAGLDPHVQEHLLTMARLHRANRYDRQTRTVEELTGTPAQTVEDFVARHADLFASGDAQRRPLPAADALAMRST